MSLSRQLILSLFLLLVLQSSCIAYLNIENTRYSMHDQMKVNAQQTATYLSFILSRPMREKNIPEATAIINAIFDSGNYQAIEIKDPEGKTLINRKLSVIKISTVPQWFVNWIPIESPFASTDIMDGWMLNGSVSVQNSPNYTYEMLYHNITYFILLISIIGIIALISMVIALHFILRPLSKTKEQAEAVALREFPIQTNIPKTTDIKAVVLAMNSMVTRLKEIFTYQAKLAEDFREKMYRNDLTKLSNYRYFMTRIETLLKIKQNFIYGAMLVIKTPEIDGFTESDHQIETQAFLAALVKMIHQQLNTLPASFAAHYNNNHIIFFIPFVSLHKSQTIGENLLQLNNTTQDQSLHLRIGLVAYAGYWSDETPDQLLQELKLALQTAEEDTKLPLHAMYHKNHALKIDIEQTLRKAIQDKTIDADLQPALSLSNLSGAPFHLEVRPSLQVSGEPIKSSGLFSYLLNNDALSLALDTLVVKHALMLHKNTTNDQHQYVIKLNAQSITSAPFIAWLKTVLRPYKTPITWLGFEISELCAINHLEEAKEFTTILQSFGTVFGLFNVGREFGSLDHIRALPIHHLKINGTFIHDIDKNENNQQFVKLLSTVARAKGAKMIAELVATDEEIATLLALEIDGIVMA